MMKKYIMFSLATTMLWVGVNSYSQRIKYHKRQFRGTWICTVLNLDWPSKAGLKVEEQKEEIVQQLDHLQSLGMNAVIFQVRPGADAMYLSSLEPWSKYLMGKQGKDPGYDPLPFIIEETHQRGMEFHAWFNPYRVTKGASNIKTLAKEHIYHQYPERFVKYGKGLLFNPGIFENRQFVIAVILDVLRRYDIDAIHFDDYFYPYKEKGEIYRDSLTFKQYPRGFAAHQLEDWRRDNVDILIKELHDSIDQIKPYVHFGISPFGVWRNKSKDPKGSETQAGQTNYDELYANVLKWNKEHWIDYVIPQNYQYMGFKIMDYRTVAHWWDKNLYGVNYYMGQAPYRLGLKNKGKEWTKGNEIKRQLLFNDNLDNYQGSAYFRYSTFKKNPKNINKILTNKIYKYPALPPISYKDRGRTNNDSIFKVQTHKEGKQQLVTWENTQKENTLFYVIYAFPKGKQEFDNPQMIYALTPHTRIQLKKRDMKRKDFFIRSLDRYRVESKPVKIL